MNYALMRSSANKKYLDDELYILMKKACHKAISDYDEQVELESQAKHNQKEIEVQIKKGKK